MREEAGHLPEAWYAAARSEALGRKKPLGVKMWGERLVLFRAADGAPVALRDRCLHRNALLSEGDVFEGCLGCPYHGWTYDREGRLVNVPSLGPEGGRPEDERRVERFATREKDGLVWVWMGRAPEPRGEPFDMPYWDAPGWGRYYMVTRFENEVTNLIENFMDVPHTVFVHRGWFRSRKKQRVPTKVERSEAGVLVTYAQPEDSIGFTSKILNPKGLPMVHTDAFFMPNVTRVDYIYGEGARGFVITSTCTPVAPFETLVFTLISFRLGHPMLNHLGRWLLPPYTRRVIEQDVEIMANQGRSLQHHGPPEFSYTAADIIHEHIQTLRARAEAGAPPPPPQTDEMAFWI
jgi:phenylpropionate dioxygenase-like ring-hydroxylating dioxygenase large terminal subunit